MTVTRLVRDSRASSGFCEALFESWKRHEIEFVVLRNYGSLPHVVGNDIDVLVRASSLEKAEALLVECASQCGLQLCNRAAFQPLSLFFCDPQSGEHVHVDLFHGFTWRSLRLLSAEQVLTLKRRCDAFWIPHPVHEAILNLLNHLLYRGTVRGKYKQKIDEMLSVQRDLSVACLGDMFGARCAAQLMKWISRADWPSIEKHVDKLRLRLVVRRLAFAPGETVRNLVADAWRLARRFARPPGLAIALLGPDGAGKSTVAEALPSHLSGVLSTGSGRYVHWKPRFLPVGGKRKTPLNPHADEPRRAVPALVLLGLHIVEFWLGWQVLVRPRLFRNGLVVLDRYYYDIALDPRRYRLSLPLWLLTASLRFVPRPDLVVLLDAPTSVLRSRKQELPGRELDRIRSRADEVSAVLSASRIDASQPVADMIRSVRVLALGFLVQRARHRCVRQDETLRIRAGFGSR